MGRKINAEIDNKQTEAILILINVVGHGHRVSFNGCEILTYIYVYKDAYICMDHIHVNYDTHTHAHTQFQQFSVHFLSFISNTREGLCPRSFLLSALSTVPFILAGSSCHFLSH